MIALVAFNIGWVAGAAWKVAMRQARREHP
jgi:hypothetical protein